MHKMQTKKCLMRLFSLWLKVFLVKTASCRNQIEKVQLKDVNAKCIGQN